jgi:hypothetical protein
MDWFERLMGFPESTGPVGYEKTRQRLHVEGQQLRSLANGRQYGIGTLELVSLQDLRHRAMSGTTAGGHTTVRVVQGDVRPMHQLPEFAGAVFQVASQFNLLEMVGPERTPEHGVAGYAGDPTQGPACAIAAGAATVYRNYFALVSGVAGQTQSRQLDGFAELGAALAEGVGRPASSLWTMRNGYAMFTRNGVDLLSAHVDGMNEAQRSAVRDRLRIGMHWDVETTDADRWPGQVVSQAFCSALPVSYNNRGRDTRGASWAPLAQLVLEAAYEATLSAAVLNAQRGASNTVLLTSLGGGAFGNDEGWIRAAIQHALRTVAGQGLDVVLVSYGKPTAELQRWVSQQV